MKFLDHFTYRDRAGNRRLRRFAAAGIVLAVVILGIVALTWYNRREVRAVVQATAVPVTVVPTATDTPMPTPTAAMQVGVPEVTPKPACPTDPAEWALTPYDPNQYLRRIEPACVYEDLARTVAWFRATSLGYTGPEAAEILGFEPFEEPYRYDGVRNLPLEIRLFEMRTFTVTNSYRQRRVARLRGAWTPMLPEYRHWWITADGRPAAAQQALVGCFRAADVRDTGGRPEVDYWWPKYPVMCWVRGATGPGHVVHRLYAETVRVESHFSVTSTTGSVTTRNYLYGATTDGRWVTLGRDLDFAHELSADRAATTLSVFAARHGLPVWDETWMQETFGLDLQPLPEGWQEWSDRQQTIIRRGSTLVENRVAEAVRSAGADE